MLQLLLSLDKVCLKNIANKFVKKLVGNKVFKVDFSVIS